MGWQVDGWTAARIRISAIWKRHPDFTAQRILAQLGVPGQRTVGSANITGMLAGFGPAQPEATICWAADLLYVAVVHRPSDANADRGCRTRPLADRKSH